MWAELTVVTMGPILIATGLAVPYTLALAGVLAVVLLITWRLKGFHKKDLKSNA